MNRPLAWIVALPLLLCFGLPARADRIHLKNGHIIHCKVVEQNKEKIHIQFDFGDVEFRMSEVETVILENDLEYFLSQGDLYLSRRSYRQATEKFLEAAELPGGRPRAEGKLAIAYMNQGEFLAVNGLYPQAIEAFQNALIYDPANSNALANVAKLTDTVEDQRARANRAKAALLAGNQRDAILQMEGLLNEAPWLHGEMSEPLAKAYIEYGDGKYEVRAFAGASDAYRKGLELNPRAGENIGVRLLNTENKLAFDAIQGGDYAQARDRLVYATSIFPTAGVSKYLLGVSYEQLKDDASARRQYLDLLAGKLNENARQLTTLRLRRHVEEALGLREAAPEPQNEDPKLWHEKQFAEAQLIETEHFKIYHHNTYVGNQVAKTAEHILKAQAELFQLNIDGPKWRKCDLFLYASRDEYVKKGLQRDWSGGSTTVRIAGGEVLEATIATFQDSPSLLNSVLPHEINHMVLHLLLGEQRTKYPLWISEGLAVTQEPIFKRNYMQRQLAQAADNGTLLPLEDVVRDKYYPADPDEVTLFYAESYSLVAMLLESGDIHTFLSFAQKAKTAPIFQALNEYYGFRTDAELTSKWRSYLRKLTR